MRGVGRTGKGPFQEWLQTTGQAVQASLQQVIANLVLYAQKKERELERRGIFLNPWKWFQTRTRLRIIAFSRFLGARIRRPFSKHVVELIECYEPALEFGGFGLGYLVFTDVGLLGSRVLETSAELSDVMSHILEWFVRPRETGYGYFHFSWNDARKTRQLDTHFELRMTSLLASTPQRVCALRKFASDVNRYEGREVFKVFYDPKASEIGEWRASVRVLSSSGEVLKHACSICQGQGACSKLEDVCNHCSALLPCSSLTDSCGHCGCLKKCMDGDCRYCGPYVLLYCRHCDLHPSIEEPPPPPSDDSSDDCPTVDNNPGDNGFLEELFLELTTSQIPPAQADSTASDTAPVPIDGSQNDGVVHESIVDQSELNPILCGICAENGSLTQSDHNFQTEGPLHPSSSGEIEELE